MHYFLGKVFCVELLLMLCTSRPMQAEKLSSPTRAQLTTRLDYLVGTANFSPSNPLSQEHLMEAISDIGFWGDFPERYKSGIKDGGSVREIMPGCDDYITRSMARRFLFDLINQRLLIWKTPQHGFQPILQGDKLGWYYNTATTMHERPRVHLVLVVRFADTVTCRFKITHKIGNLSNGPPDTLVGSGTATLSRRGLNWFVTSWQVNRNHTWVYNTFR